jgi:hypothetical protein
MAKEYPLYWAKDAERYAFDVKFKVGGERQVKDTWVEPLNL